MVYKCTVLNILAVPESVQNSREADIVHYPGPCSLSISLLKTKTVRMGAEKLLHNTGQELKD